MIEMKNAQHDVKHLDLQKYQSPISLCGGIPQNEKCSSWCEAPRSAKYQVPISVCVCVCGSTVSETCSARSAKISNSDLMWGKEVYLSVSTELFVPFFSLSVLQRSEQTFMTLAFRYLFLACSQYTPFPY